ncbi:MAG: porin, partial [Nitrospirota bacterium]
MGKKVLAGFMAVFALISFVSPSIASETGIRRQLNYGSPSSFAEFHGFMDLLYFDFEGNNDDNGQRTIDMHNFYLSAKSSIRENIFIYGEIEYEHGGDEIKFEQGYIDWEVNPEVNLKIGQFFTPFGIDKTNSVLPPLNKLASKPQVIDQLVYGDWPDAGVAIYGYEDIQSLYLSYDLAIIKGPAGLLKSGLQNRENNQNNMFVGRLIFNPLYNNDYIMDIGLSYADGKYDNASTNDLTLYGLYARFITDDLDLRGEYMKRRGDD